MEDIIQKWIKKLELNENTVSTVMGGLVLLVVGVLFYNYYTNGKNGADSPTPDTSDQVGAIGETSSTSTSAYTIREGDTLWSIAEEKYNDGYAWVKIAEANELVNPNVIEEGQTLDLPNLPQMQTTGQVVDTPDVSGESEITQETDVRAPSTRVVARGEYLWQIARDVYGDGHRWVEIWELNRGQIANPNVLLVGQELRMP